MPTLDQKRFFWEWILKMSSAYIAHDMLVILHYFRASPLKDQAEAFEDGKNRAISTLQAQIDRIKSYTHDDYKKCYCIEEVKTRFNPSSDDPIDY